MLKMSGAPCVLPCGGSFDWPFFTGWDGPLENLWGGAGEEQKKIVQGKIK